MLSGMFSITATGDGTRYEVMWNAGQIEAEPFIADLIRSEADLIAVHGIGVAHFPPGMTMPRDLLSRDWSALAVMRQVFDSVSEPTGRMSRIPSVPGRVYAAAPAGVTVQGPQTPA
jgi:hypothetical protein